MHQIYAQLSTKQISQRVMPWISPLNDHALTLTFCKYLGLLLNLSFPPILSSLFNSSKVNSIPVFFFFHNSSNLPFSLTFNFFSLSYSTLFYFQITWKVLTSPTYLFISLYSFLSIFRQIPIPCSSVCYFTFSFRLFLACAIFNHPQNIQPPSTLRKFSSSGSLFFIARTFRLFDSRGIQRRMVKIRYFYNRSRPQRLVDEK